MTKTIRYIGAMGAVVLPTFGELKRGETATIPAALADAYIAQAPRDWEVVEGARDKKSFREKIVEKEK